MHSQRSGLFVAWLVLGAIAASAQTAQPGQAAKKWTVSVSHSGQDLVGGQLAFAVREALRRSAGYEVMAKAKDALFRIDIVSLDTGVVESNSGNRTAAAVVYSMRNWNDYKPKDPQTWFPIYLTSKVAIAGRNAVDSSALSIAADLDAAVEEFFRLAGD